MAHVTIPDTAPRVQYTVGGTSTTNFTIPFAYFADSDIKVYVGSTLKTLSTDYTITGTAVDEGYSGGTVVLGTGVTNTTVTVIRDVPVKRITDFPTNGPFNITQLNTELDALTAQLQQEETGHDLFLRIAEYDTYTDLTLPVKADRAGTVLGFNATTGDPEAGPTIADVSTLAAITADIATLADIEDGTDATDAIQTVAGISGNVTTVAGISGNVTTVAGISADVTAVVADATDIGTVASNISNVNAVAGNETNINAAVANASNINAVVANATNINTVAGIDSDVSTVAGIAADVTAVANNEVDVSQVAADIAKVIEVANDLQETVSEIDTVANNIADVNTVGTAIADVSAVAAIDSDVTTVSGISANVTTVAGVSANVTTVAGISANVTTVAGISANVTTVAGDSADIATVAGISADVSAVAAIDSDITTAAANVTDITNFADVYIGASATAPSTRNDSSALQVGDLYFDTSTDTMKVYSSGGWINAGSSVNGTANRYDYVVGTSSGSYTGSTTNFPATYDAGYVDVFLNGTKLVPTTDFTATSGTEIVLGTAASSGSNICIVGYGTFSLANFSVGDANDVDLSGISDGDALLYNSTSGNFEAGPVDALPSQTGNSGKYLTTDGSTASWDAPFEGGAVFNESGADVDFRIESDTNENAFFLEGSSGNVGIGTSSPSQLLHIGSTSIASGNAAWQQIQTNGNNMYVGIGTNNSAYVQANGEFRIATGGYVDRVTVDSSGRVTMPYQPAFMAQRSLGVVSSGNIYIFDNVSFNTGNHYNSSTGAFTAPVTGVYHFDVIMLLNNNNASNEYYWRALLNGSTTLVDCYSMASVANHHYIYPSSFTIKMTANDYIQIKIQSGIFYGGTVNNLFSGFLVG